MGKNGNGEGSIYEHKRNGKKVGYRGSYTVYTVTGPKRRYLSGKTREEVRQKLTKVMADRDGGMIFDARSLTVEEYLTRWLEDSVKGTVRASTYEVHRHMIKPHILPTLGRLKLKDLSPMHVRSFYREKLNSGLSSATVRKMHSVLRKALKQAILDGLIPRNACEAVKPPKVERKEITPLDREQARTFQCGERRPPGSPVRAGRPHRHEGGRASWP
jgi:integrase